MILRRSIRQRLSEFQCNMLTNGKAENAVGSIGQTEGKATRVVTDGFLFNEGKRGEFDRVQCWFDFLGFEEGEDEYKGGDDNDCHCSDDREREGG